MAPELLFEKILTTSHLTDRMSIPMAKFTDFFSSVGENRHVINVIDINDPNGRVWNFTCTRRRQGHPKPDISGAEWVRFVQSKQLKLGDRVAFYALEGQGYGVLARKPFKLFGVVHADHWENA